MADAKESVRLAAVGDIHVTKSSQGALQQFFSQVNEAADVLILCGDLTDYGLPEEAHVLAREMTTALKVPCVAVLHYSPVRSTCEGEPPEIFAFLGTGRLEEPINRYRARAVFHGHAHSGSPEGATARGVPVYNVAMPVLRRHFPEQPPFRLLELRTADEPAEPAAQAQSAAAS